MGWKKNCIVSLSLLPVTTNHAMKTPSRIAQRFIPHAPALNGRRLCQIFQRVEQGVDLLNSIVEVGGDAHDGAASGGGDVARGQFVHDLLRRHLRALRMWREADDAGTLARPLRRDDGI